MRSIPFIIMIYTKPNRFFTRSKSEKPRFIKRARLLGRELQEGIYQGISDNPALLHAQYDDETTSEVDPLCQLGGDRFDRVLFDNPVPSPSVTKTSQDSATDTTDVKTDVTPVSE